MEPMEIARLNAVAEMCVYVLIWTYRGRALSVCLRFQSESLKANDAALGWPTVGEKTMGV